jgi:hypothetical protein
MYPRDLKSPKSRKPEIEAFLVSPPKILGPKFSCDAFEINWSVQKCCETVLVLFDDAESDFCVGCDPLLFGVRSRGERTTMLREVDAAPCIIKFNFQK